MTEQEWIDDARKRITAYEGERAMRYFDSRGIPTIGIGFNLTRADTFAALRRAGVPGDMVSRVVDGELPLTPLEIANLFDYSFAPVVSEARASLEGGIFDSLTDARRFVLCDLVYNLGYGGWMSFYKARMLINDAQRAKIWAHGNAHELFVEAANDLRSTLWAQQVGERAVKDCAMLEAGVYV